MSEQFVHIINMRTENVGPLMIQLKNKVEDSVRQEGLDKVKEPVVTALQEADQAGHLLILGAPGRNKGAMWIAMRALTTLHESLLAYGTTGRTTSP